MNWTKNGGKVEILRQGGRLAKRAWMGLSKILGWCMTHLLMTLTFYLIITPMGLIARMFGKDFLNRQLDRNLKTYWIPKPPPVSYQSHYENQY